MKQECSIWMVWLTWLGVPIMAIAIGFVADWEAALFVLIFGVCAQILYVRMFPRISHLLGYGSVGDTAVDHGVPSNTPVGVILYTASVCPFCPLVRSRLSQLQRTLGFQLKEVDVTFQPGLVLEKGIRSVPVVEVEGRYWFGNATTAELAAFIMPPDSKSTTGEENTRKSDTDPIGSFKSTK